VGGERCLSRLCWR